MPDPATGAGADAANANAQAITAEASLPERDEHDRRDVYERAGVVPLKLAAPLQERWDDQAMGDVLTWSAEQRIPGPIMQPEELEARRAARRAAFESDYNRRHGLAEPASTSHCHHQHRRRLDAPSDGTRLATYTVAQAVPVE